MTIRFRRHTLSIAARLTMLALSTALPLVALAVLSSSMRLMTSAHRSSAT
jgi:hypothetical protein